jgi:plasmid stabilization system protein ParE
VEYSIIWSDTAIADLTEIARYIARDNPQAARSKPRRVEVLRIQHTARDIPS